MMKRKVLLPILIIYSIILTSIPIFATDYQLTFDINGGNFASQPPAQTYAEDTVIDVLALPTPHRIGYTFDYWSYNNTPITETFTMPAEHVILLAIWKENEQPINFTPLLEHVEHMPTNFLLPTGSLLQLADLSIPKHARYTFDGWLLNNTKVTQDILVPIGGILLTPLWKGSFEEIIFNPTGGELGRQENKLSRVIGTNVALTELPIPTKSGHHFLGWSDGQKKVLTDFNMKEGTQEFSALWEKTLPNLKLSAKSATQTLEASEPTTINFETLFHITAKDSIDGDITNKITYTPQMISTNMLGTHQITASIYNSKNDHSTMLLTLTIQDTIAPTLSFNATHIQQKVGSTLPNNILDLFAYEAQDVGSGQNITTTIEGIDSIQVMQPTTQTIKLTATDLAGNATVQSLQLTFAPLTYEGTIFSDTNLNSLHDEQQFVHDLEVQLVTTTKPETIVDSVHTDMNGRFTLTAHLLPDTNTVTTAYKICINNKKQFVTAPQIAKPPYHQYSQFFEGSNCTAPFETAGVDYKQIFLGVQPQIEFSLENSIIRIDNKKRKQIYIPLSYGKMSTIHSAHEAIGEIERMNNGIIFSANEPGSTIITITLEDIYGRPSSTSFSFEIIVNAG